MQAPSVGGVMLPRGHGQTVRLSRGASLTDFAEKINANPASLVAVMMNIGEMVTATQSVSDETLQLLADEMNYVVEIVSPEEEDRELLESFDIEFGEDEGGEEFLVSRPPVVTVMGHVDHGKTRLLDAIRKTNVVAGEAGGITQHIGAYQVATDVNGEERRITFIDTPGHEAFTAMRARGAKSTDIAILVVAANDGVMPQTIEALNHAKAADVPIVVAVNKIDVEGADPTKVRGQLTEFGLVAEEYGGDTMFVDISAKQGLNIDSLLEAVVLTADASLDLRANPEQDAQGIAIEAHLDRGRGAVATVLVQRGTLRVGDTMVAGDAYGRVRAMLDDNGDNVDEATPSTPVLVLGLTNVPGAGDNFLVVDEDRTARQIAEKRAARERNAAFARRGVRFSLENLDEALKAGLVQELNLIIKGDASGSVEALESSLLQLDVGEEVDIRVLHRGVGAVTESDIDLAMGSDAIVIGFNVRAAGRAAQMAEREGVDVRYYSVIYQAIEEIEVGPQGHAQAGVRRGRARYGGDPRGLPLVQAGQHRGCSHPLRRGQAQHQGPARPRWQGRRGGPQHPGSAPLQGRRHRDPRRLRGRYQPRKLQRHQDRRRHRDVRDAREAARLTTLNIRGRSTVGISVDRPRPLRVRFLCPCQVLAGVMNPYRRDIRMFHVCGDTVLRSPSRRRTVAEGETLRRPADRRRAPAEVRGECGGDRRPGPSSQGRDRPGGGLG